MPHGGAELPGFCLLLARDREPNDGEGGLEAVCPGGKGAKAAEIGLPRAEPFAKNENNSSAVSLSGERAATHLGRPEAAAPNGYFCATPSKAYSRMSVVYFCCAILKSS